MKLVVGLGNPGREHEATRHNAGYWWIDRLAARTGTNLRAEARCGLLACVWRITFPARVTVHKRMHNYSMMLRLILHGLLLALTGLPALAQTAPSREFRTSLPISRTRCVGCLTDLSGRSGYALITDDQFTSPREPDGSDSCRSALKTTIFSW